MGGFSTVECTVVGIEEGSNAEMRIFSLAFNQSFVVALFVE